MADFVHFKDVECVFPMSSQYGRAPRALYYALLIFAIGLKGQNWLTAGAAAACLTYGGSAAIHALILAPIPSLGKPPVPHGTVQLPNSTLLDITPLAIDLDSDATLAIVGTGFLIIIPMALWSERFRHSGAVPILVLWILLMFVGMISCMVNTYVINGSSSGPLLQSRFCSPGYNNTYPFSGNPTLLSEIPGMKQYGCTSQASPQRRRQAAYTLASAPPSYSDNQGTQELSISSKSPHQASCTGLYTSLPPWSMVAYLSPLFSASRSSFSDYGVIRLP